MEKHLILVINPGSTSTKVALFKSEQEISVENLIHSEKEFSQFPSILDQLEFRKRAIEDFLKEQKISVKQLSAIVGRGGLFRPIDGGTYLVNKKMMQDAREGKQGQHSSNLGCLLAHLLAKRVNIPAYVVDPVSVDEFEPLARYSGHSLIERRCLSHALNIHMVARWTAEKLNIPLEKSSFVVAHLGGGISIAPVKQGKIIDVNDATGAGPFSPDRTGTLPLQAFIEICVSGKYSKSEIKKMVMGEGGLKSYFGTANAMELEKRIQAGDQKVREVLEAMAYQIAKEIGAMSTVLSGKINAIILTGGLVNYKRLLNWIEKRIEFIAPIEIIPGEFEMEALAAGALRVLQRKEVAKEY
jgi:butyrate kinase